MLRNNWNATPTPFEADMVKIVNALVKSAASRPKRNIGDGDGPDEEAEDSRPKKKSNESTG
jgi:hypothetical protein